MFTNATLSTSNWLQQKDHVLRLTPDQFSIASRSVLVGFSLGPRSCLVRLSLLIR